MNTILLELLKGLTLPPFVENILIPGIIMGIILVIIALKVLESFGFTL